MAVSNPAYPPPRPGLQARCPVVAIVGGGMAGTLTAVHLVQGATRPLEVVLLDREGVFGPGVAYAAPSDQHLLNQPAARMSAFADMPGHFTSWAADRDGRRDPGAFLPRRMYGEYLRSLLADAARRRAPGVKLHRIDGEAVALTLRADRPSLELADGRTLMCDRVVLACGPLPARRPAALPIDPRVIADPWAPGALASLPRGATAVLVGTGLTAVDATLSLCDAGVRVVAVSRHGMLPHAHLDGVRPPAPPPAPPSAPIGVDDLERLIRGHFARMREAGYDWRDVVDGIRPVVPDLWRSLPVSERRRFVRTHARAWEVRRHRMAPQVARRIRDLQASGRLVVLAGEVVGARASDRGIDVAIDRHRADGVRAVTAARVIACTGAGTNIAGIRDPLLRALLAGGYAAPDPLGLGLRTSPSGTVLDRQGRGSEVLSTLGALRRGELWESTAAAEIRTQARDVAAELCRSLGVAGTWQEAGAA